MAFYVNVNSDSKLITHITFYQNNVFYYSYLSILSKVIILYKHSA
jgi:hypothetical protein